MKTDPEIRRYLASVQRATSALPNKRRKELIHDLGEHIEVALAERPDQLLAILNELGDPQEIAATALQESGADTCRSVPRNPQLVVGALALGSVLSLVGRYLSSVPLTAVAVVALLGGFAVMCVSPWWRVTRRWLAVGWLLVPNWILNTVHDAVSGSAQGVHIAVSALSLAIRAGTLLWLWRRREVPLSGRLGLPRWVVVLCWSVLGVVALVAVFILITTSALSGNLHEVGRTSLSP